MSLELYTEDRLVYQFYPANGNSISFRVKAKHDAHIALTTTPYVSQPMYEILLGGWDNTKSVIRRNEQKPDLIEAYTPSILNEHELRGFWIRWEYGLIAVGTEGNFTPILQWSDPSVNLQYFGVRTGWGAKGHWLIQATGQPAPGPPPQGLPPQMYPGAPGGYPGQPGPYPGQPGIPAPGFNPGYVSQPGYGQPGYGGYGAPTNAPVWLPASHGSVPPSAVSGGTDCNGEPLYVIRAHHEGALIPGKLVPSHRCAYVAWGGKENSKHDYEILCSCAPRWVPSGSGQIPPGALPGGRSENGETLYIGRAFHQGSNTIGKVQPSHGVCYIAFGGDEVPCNSYEVLVL